MGLSQVTVMKIQLLHVVLCCVCTCVLHRFQSEVKL